MSYTVSLNPMGTPYLVVVGCGGTGGFVAEGLCRLKKITIPIYLVDHDRVEPRNLLRQNFFAEDVGKFKAQALAERLARNYGRKIGYSVFPYDRDMFNDPTSIGYRQQMSLIIIGCVDNALARRDIAKSMKRGDWWLDAGNGNQSGQVLFGNAVTTEGLQEGFERDTHVVTRLPAPSLQLPSLLAPPTEPVRPADCAEAVAADEQSPIINQAMATLILEFLYRLSMGRLDWMGAYINLEAGTLQTVPIEPVTVARICGVKVNWLMANPSGCAAGRSYHIERTEEEMEEDD